MSQAKEYAIIRGQLKPPEAWTGKLFSEQYIKMLEIKYSRLERGENENTSFCKILCEAIDLLHSREAAAGKITVRVKEAQKINGKGKEF